KNSGDKILMINKQTKRYLYFSLIMVTMFTLIASGCITDVPFDITTEEISLILNPPIGIYGETIVWVPAEARETGVIIDEAELIYSVQNLGSTTVEAKVYISLSKNASESGELIFHKTLKPYETLKDTLKHEIITNAIKQDRFYIGAELSNSVSLYISGSMKINGKYDVLARWY
ncbi:hypothetical protein KAJ27_03755, partial [bacterium]|nr:hypothetical protein [bacterium]